MRVVSSSNNILEYGPLRRCVPCDWLAQSPIKVSAVTLSFMGDYTQVADIGSPTYQTPGFEPLGILHVRRALTLIENYNDWLAGP